MRKKGLLTAIIGISLVLVLALALPLGACAPAPTPTPTPTPTPPPPPPPEKIKVGHLVPLTGFLSFIGEPFANAGILAVEHINAAGGVLGAEVEVIAEDTATDPKTGVDAIEKLIKIDKVQAIVGGVTSGTSMAVVPKLALNKVLMISPSATAAELTEIEDDDFLFRTCPADTLQAAAIAILAWEKGYRTANVICRDDAYGRGLGGIFTETFEGLGGEVLVSVIYDPAAPDYSGYVVEVSSVPADVIQVNALMEDGCMLFKLFHDMGVMEEYEFLVCEGVQDPGIPQEVGVDIMVGVGGATPYPAESGTFPADFEARWEEPPFAYEANVYDNFVLLALAIERAGVYDGTAIRDNLRAVANPLGIEVTDVAAALLLVREGFEINYQGAGGKITFDDFGDVFMKAARVWEYDEEGNYIFIREIEVF